MNIVEKIVNGSRALDRMERDTDQLIKTLLGLRGLPRGYSSDLIGSPPRITWEIGWNEVSQQVMGKPRIRCLMDYSDGLRVAYTTDPTYIHSADGLRMYKFVQAHTQTKAIYESLEPFVEELLERTPLLRSRLQSILDAAD